jgi:hypothetical protein
MYVIYFTSAIGERVFLEDEFSCSLNLMDAKTFPTYSDALSYFQSIEGVFDNAPAQAYFIGKCSVASEGFIGVFGKEEV